MSILGWILRGQVTASAMALFHPGQSRLFAWQWLSAFASSSSPIIIVHNIRRGGHPCQQIPDMGIATHYKQICISFCARVIGRAHVTAISLLITALSQWQLRQLRESWQGGDGDKVNGSNFKIQRSFLWPVSSFGVGLSRQFYNTSLLSSVNFHAALGGGWPIWQPLNIDVATPFWQDASMRLWRQQLTVATRQQRHSSFGCGTVGSSGFHQGWIIN